MLKKKSVFLNYGQEKVRIDYIFDLKPIKIYRNYAKVESKLEESNFTRKPTADVSGQIESAKGKVQKLEKESNASK